MTRALVCLQLLEEPGKDTAKFDSLMPTIVKPISRDTYYTDNPEQVSVACIHTQCLSCFVLRGFNGDREPVLYLLM